MSDSDLTKKYIIPNLKPFFEQMGEMAISLNKSFSKFGKIILQYNDMIEQWSQRISTIIKPLVDGTIVENYKSSFEEWGNYGWTIIESAPISLFFEIPQTQIDADKIALRYLKKSELELLFKDLYTYKIKKLELDEAIKCFKSSCYKACAMIVISMIEQKLLNFQDRNGEFDSKKVGGKAVSRFNTYMSNSGGIDEKSIKYLLYCNITVFLKKLFESANNFKDEPDFLNRNFIMHGMTKKKVRRKDCIKLFLALKNFLLLSEFYNFKC
ncbi:hypothetical protein SDC9_48645 [bioreactor metagenome]|uniref:Uncharacterized protein n=1 Tax=bioreactor metagenome TaxID=1076179 RepID=A0A644WFR8_9ZZZZ